MLAGFAADLVVALHFAFILFVVAGGLLALRWPRLAWVHLPLVAWGAGIELIGWVCPLTPLENVLRRAAGQAGYAGGFIDHYLTPLIYPPGLTREHQLALGLFVTIVNVVIYGMIALRRCRLRQRSRGEVARS
ncbi:MAG: DUF2784 domain-containing protein [Aromatoleum sp.]|jgi:hypothetical protein|uniref:DUF2784 domain-containing protein n=1 Tax=Aromatoleum sp. TaxID=2307007 RepID=UPI002895A04C|nr:DUF2784 domain-containing protein [Aromatoleum sp.]MDT3671990.1 DUF2784 domain-containing protein [Aromatoleum sp.]